MEVLLAELATFARAECDCSVSELGLQAMALLTKVSDKKSVVTGIEQAGLTLANAAAVRTWLGEVRELQIALAASVGTVVAQSALARTAGNLEESETAGRNTACTGRQS
jgi:hypothetical protein